MKFIYETAVYDGRTKEWRVLNLMSGSLYANTYHTERDALDSIEDGKGRLLGFTVKSVSLREIRDYLNGLV